MIFLPPKTPCVGLTAGKDRRYMPRCCKWETGRAQTSLWKHMRFRIPSLAPDNFMKKG
nr:MAG TPA: hypothetical protein [Caudoviricetes sp.]